MIVNMLNNFAAGCATKGIQIIPPWYKYLNLNEDSQGGCDVAFTFPNDLGSVLLALLEIILRVGAMVAVGFVIYGGFQYMLSQGEPDRTKNARTTIVNAVVGLVVTVLATAIVNFVGQRLAA